MPEIKDNPLAIIGDEDTVLGFSAFGFRVYAIKEAEEISQILEEIAQNNCAICLVQDDIFSQEKDKIDKYRYLPLPIFIPFSQKIKADLLATLIKEMRLKATGAF